MPTIDQIAEEAKRKANQGSFDNFGIGPSGSPENSFAFVAPSSYLLNKPKGDKAGGGSISRTIGSSAFDADKASASVSWWSENYVAKYGGTHNAKFDIKNAKWDQSKIDLANTLFLNTATGILANPADPTAISAYRNAAFLWEKQVREAGVLGRQVGDLLSVTVAESQLSAIAAQQGFLLNNWGTYFPEDNDPASDRYFDDFVLKSTGLVFDAGGQTPADRDAAQKKAIDDAMRANRPKGPVYERPDDDLVRDAVRGQLRATVANVDEVVVEELKDLFMQKHRADWNDPSQEIDAFQAVREAIRKRSEYQQIHKLRPKDIDETDWVGAAIQSQRQEGVSEEAARTRGIDLAVAGTTQGDASSFQQQRLGRSNSFLDKASAVAGALGKVLK